MGDRKLYSTEKILDRLSIIGYKIRMFEKIVSESYNQIKK